MRTETAPKPAALPVLPPASALTRAAERLDQADNQCRLVLRSRADADDAERARVELRLRSGAIPGDPRQLVHEVARAVSAVSALDLAVRTAAELLDVATRAIADASVALREHRIAASSARALEALEKYESDLRTLKVSSYALASGLDGAAPRLATFKASARRLAQAAAEVIADAHRERTASEVSVLSARLAALKRQGDAPAVAEVKAALAELGDG